MKLGERLAPVLPGRLSQKRQCAYTALDNGVKVLLNGVLCQRPNGPLIGYTVINHVFYCLKDHTRQILKTNTVMRTVVCLTLPELVVMMTTCF